MIPVLYTDKAKIQLKFIKKDVYSINNQDIEDLENAIRNKPTIILTGEVYNINGIEYKELYRSKCPLVSSEPIYNKHLIFYFINLGSEIRITYIEHKTIRPKKDDWQNSLWKIKN